MRFDSYHPCISLIFFAFVIVCACAFDQPIFLGIGFMSAFIYSVYLRRMPGLLTNLAFLAGGIVFAGFYAGFNHFGVTTLGENLIGNKMTLESLVAGGVIGLKLVIVCMWVECILTIVSSDMVVYLFGRLWPQLGLFVSIGVRLLPRISRRYRRANEARSGVGRGLCQGGAFECLRNEAALLSSTLTWTIEGLIMASDSMRSRGFGCNRDHHTPRVRRTAFSIYRFDARDRGVVLAMFACMIIVAAGVALDQTTILYDPVVVMNRVTPLSVVFYLAYGVLCLMPTALQAVGEARFRRLRYAA